MVRFRRKRTNRKRLGNLKNRRLPFENFWCDNKSAADPEERRPGVRERMPYKGGDFLVCFFQPQVLIGKNVDFLDNMDLILGT